MTTIWRIFLALTLAAGLQAGTASAALLGVDFGAPGTLYDVNDTTGALSNPRSTTPAGTLIGIALNPAGTLLYSINAGTDQTVVINPITGATSVVGATGINVIEGDLAFGPTGTLYGAYSISGADDAFFSVDLATGAATVIGTLAVDDLSALAFSGGTLYGLDSHVNTGGTPSLVTLNPVTGAVLTNVPTTGLNAIFALAGMTFGSNGTLYVAGGGSLYTLDPVTGAGTLVGTHSPDLTGLAFVAPTAVPEPATLALLGAGLAGLGFARRKQ